MIEGQVYMTTVGRSLFFCSWEADGATFFHKPKVYSDIHAQDSFGINRARAKVKLASMNAYMEGHGSEMWCGESDHYADLMEYERACAEQRDPVIF